MTLSLDDLFRIEMEQLKQEHGREPDPDSWRWSPFDIRKFDGMLKIAYQYYRVTDQHTPGPISIAEAGSGIGTKLYLAKHKYGMIEYGFENNEDYIAKARELGVACELRDLSDFDNQPNWSAYDIVYTARPFKNELKEHQWEGIVQGDMRPGAVRISTFASLKPYEWYCLYRGTYRGVWVKPFVPADPGDKVMEAVTVS